MITTLPRACPVPEVVERLLDVGQLEGPVDHRRHLPGVDQVAEDHEVRAVRLRQEEGGSRARSDRGESCRQEVPHRAEHESLLRPADQEEQRVLGQHPPARGPAPAPGDVEKQVVAPAGECEVDLRVVDGLIRAERPDELHVAGAADSRDLGAHRLRDLHCERADPSGRAVHVVAGLEPLDRRPHSLDRACEVAPEPRILRLPDAAHQPGEIRRARHVVPVDRIHRRCPDADEQSVFGHGRLLGFLEPYLAVALSDDHLHTYGVS